MKIKLIGVGLLVAALSSCQSTNQASGKLQWVQFQAGDVFEIADAKCRMMANTQAQGIYARGDAGFVLGAHLGNAIGNAIRIEQFYKQCMTISGWRQEKVIVVKAAPAVQSYPAKPVAGPG